MAHFAEIDKNNIVTRVLVISNDQEHRGEDFLSKDCGLGGRWIQTSYNNNFRKNFASIGYLYIESLDIFISQKPFNSWILDEESLEWKAPVAIPSIDEGWEWDENSISWKPIQENNTNIL